MSKQVITQADSMSVISAKMSQNYDELLAKIEGEQHTDAECYDAFIAEMNKYAVRFGMNDTNFVNPHGLNHADHYSCAKDLARLIMNYASRPRVIEFMWQDSYSVEVGGPNARTISGDAAYKGYRIPSVADYYHIYTGKGGTLLISGTNYENLCMICKSKVDDAWLCGCIMYNTYNPGGESNNRGVPFKEMLDWLEDYRQDPATPTPTIQAQYCSAWVMPPHTLTAYGDVDLQMVGKSSTTHAKPASCTKMMTAIIAFDHLSMDETITVKAGDIEGGSGDTFYDGDTLNAGDAMLAFMIKSSNTLGHTIARVVGEKILNAK